MESVICSCKLRIFSCGKFFMPKDLYVQTILLTFALHKHTFNNYEDEEN